MDGAGGAQEENAGLSARVRTDLGASDAAPPQKAAASSPRPRSTLEGTLAPR